MDQTEEYAIRALLRHYWKKGLVAEATVREICAVEGPGTVDIEMARNWFALFESGHTRLEPKKIIWLPSETWEDVFKFVQFRYFAKVDKQISAHREDNAPKLPEVQL
uniref:HTH_48 domain-containing protein n=1 Tax=Globodera pallida TaxID=36090 RepID=A0A183C628_GLOPA